MILQTGLQLSGPEGSLSLTHTHTHDPSSLSSEKRTHFLLLDLPKLGSFFLLLSSLSLLLSLSHGPILALKDVNMSLSLSLSLLHVDFSCAHSMTFLHTRYTQVKYIVNSRMLMCPTVWLSFTHNIHTVNDTIIFDGRIPPSYESPHTPLPFSSISFIMTMTTHSDTIRAAGNYTHADPCMPSQLRTQIHTLTHQSTWWLCWIEKGTNCDRKRNMLHRTLSGLFLNRKHLYPVKPH